MASTLFSQALDANAGGINTDTQVIRFEPAALTMPTGTITKIKVTFEAGTTEALTVTNAYIGHAAASGDAYDFSDTPVQLLASGGASFVISISSTLASDLANFSYDKTSALLVAFYVGSGTSTDTARAKAGLANITRYTKTANDAATVNKTGYSSTAGSLYAINKIEVETSLGHKLTLLGVGS